MKIALYGNGGHAREVAAHINKDITFFVDDQFVTDTTLPLSSFDAKKYQIMIAISNPIDRLNIVNKLPKDTVYFTYIHPSALILSNNVIIGPGSFIGANCVLTTNIKIGNHCILNRAVHVGHDVEIGNYFSAMPGSVISGNVIIEDCVYLGTNSSIKEKTSISNLVTIGMGAAVVNHIEKPGTYVGVPAKLIK